MKAMLSLLFASVSIVLLTSSGGAASGAEPVYPWLDHAPGERIVDRYAPPDGFVRTSEDRGSFGEWLRNLPLLPGRPKVMLYDGREKGNQAAHDAVVDMDVGNRDLQQCADAIMRLRAEYLRQAGQGDRISFRFTNGTPAGWRAWRQGFRPKVTGNRVTWVKTAAPSSGYRTFRNYLTRVFQYAGTASLSREMKAVKAAERMESGDVFIQGGFPGHAVIVVDTAAAKDGAQIFLLAQSYMPAQQVHILKNPNDEAVSPWYRYRPGPLRTPEWHFPDGSHKRFDERGRNP